MVLLNAALGLITSKQNLSPKEAIHLSAEMIDSGRAMAKLRDFIAITNTIGQVAI